MLPPDGSFLYRTRKPTSETRCMCPLYDSSRQAWITLQPMSAPRLGHGVVTAGQCSPAITWSPAGNTSVASHHLNEWSSLKIKINWSIIILLCFCLLEGFLFAIGGADEHNTVLDSGEKYDPDTNTWSPIPPMLQVRLHFSWEKHFHPSTKLFQQLIFTVQFFLTISLPFFFSFTTQSDLKKAKQLNWNLLVSMATRCQQ